MAFLVSLFSGAISFVFPYWGLRAPTSSAADSPLPWPFELHVAGYQIQDYTHTRTAVASKNCGGRFGALSAGGSCTSGDSAVKSAVSIGVACFDCGVDFAGRFWGRERERDVNFSGVELPIARVDDGRR